MINRVMVVVLLGCVGLTAGLAFGTLVSTNQITAPQTACHPLLVRHQHENDWRHYSNLGPGGRPSGKFVLPNQFAGDCQINSQATTIADGPMGGYVLFGLLAGLSAALGFLMPPGRSNT